MKSTRKIFAKFSYGTGVDQRSSTIVCTVPVHQNSQQWMPALEQQAQRILQSEGVGIGELRIAAVDDEIVISGMRPMFVSRSA